MNVYSSADIQSGPNKPKPENRPRGRSYKVLLAEKIPEEEPINIEDIVGYPDIKIEFKTSAQILEEYYYGDKSKGDINNQEGEEHSGEMSHQDIAEHNETPEQILSDAGIDINDDSDEDFDIDDSYSSDNETNEPTEEGQDNHTEKSED